MIRRNALLLIAGGLVATTLSACTSFAPVYGPSSAGASLADARFNFAPPTNRTEQIILQRLKLAFPNPAGPTDPTLKVAAYVTNTPAVMSNAMKVGTPVGVRVEGTVTISNAGEKLFEAKRFTDSAYQGGKLAPTNSFSAKGTEEQVAESTAESLRAAILAGYRPAAISTPLR